MFNTTEITPDDELIETTDLLVHGGDLLNDLLWGANDGETILEAPFIIDSALTLLMSRACAVHLYGEVLMQCRTPHLLFPYNFEALVLLCREVILPVPHHPFA